jgi:hypothetical protein
MYVENKATRVARIAWVGFSRTGRTVYFGDRTLSRHHGISGNFVDTESGEEYWISAPKKRGGDAHPAEIGTSVTVDDDAKDEWLRLRAES